MNKRNLSHRLTEKYILFQKVKDAKKKEKEKTQRKDKTTSKLGRSYHVCSLEVEPQDKSRNFEIFLDGIRYGPFAKIKFVSFFALASTLQ
jgi:hypothetical protein